MNPTSQKQPAPVAPALPLAEVMPLLLASPLKSVPTNYTPKRTSNSSKPLKKRSLKLSESDKESQIKELEAITNNTNALTTVIEDNKEPPVISINEEGVINEIKPVNVKETTKDVELDIPVTPKKQEDLTFKTPHKKSPQGRRSPSLLKTPKTPRSHLPLSSIQELLSPIAGFRRAVPKTPKSKQK